EQAGERAPVGAEPLQRVESAHPGHLDVEEGDVETVRVDLAQGLCSVGGLGYDLDGGIGVEDPDDAGPHEGVVVGDQDSDRGLGRCHRSPPAMYSVLETLSCAEQILYTAPAAASKVVAVTAESWLSSGRFSHRQAGRSLPGRILSVSARTSPTLMLEKTPADSSARWFCTTVSASTAASPTTTIAAVEARISRWRSFVLPVERSSTSLVASTARS